MADAPQTYDLHATLLRKEQMLVASLAGLEEVIQHKAAGARSARTSGAT
jgi:hypothetical protein